MKIRNIQIEVTGAISDDVRTAAQDISDELLLRIYDIEYATDEAAYEHMNKVLDGLLEKTFGPQNRKPIDENVSFVPVF